MSTNIGSFETHSLSPILVADPWSFFRIVADAISVIFPLSFLNRLTFLSFIFSSISVYPLSLRTMAAATLTGHMSLSATATDMPTDSFHSSFF